MSSGFSDLPRYGRTTFAAFAINVLLLQFMTWVLLTTAPYFIPVIALPVTILDALIAWALTRREGRTAQIGRGLAIACLTPLLTLLIFIPGWIISRNFGH
ncbi:hypothetical protein BayCH28_25230 [Mycolicibacterium sp. CH28]|uniref:hypothetical protein n=1 Tax=Mycolicibacterium sp. CH28 TaxID=2512237 RepID=UPI0010812EBF|nr:hypothetical protein [Mycolicibacterium sp. CH28]TGD84695.1 hypothetical protein BayCH28_25230 [Mycolicibacterium sp. CH28]